MPKMKSHKGAADRIKVTGSGKLRRRQVGLNHFLGKKTAKQKRRLTGTTDVSDADKKRIRRLLGR